MNTPNACGATTSLVIVCPVVLVLVGILFAFITMGIGGKKQAEHAIQAGSLVLMKAACQIAVPVSSLTSDQKDIITGAFPPNA